jgi:hypothetical protein
MTNLEIAELGKEDEAAWDAYVYNSATSTFYHQLRSVLIKLFNQQKIWEMWSNAYRVYK